MGRTAADALEQPMSLDEKVRASIAGALIESLHSPADAGVQKAWDRGIKRRVAELNAGTVTTVPRSEVRDRLVRGLE